MFTEGEKWKAWNSGNIIKLGPLTFSSPQIDCISELSHPLTGHSVRQQTSVCLLLKILNSTFLGFFHF